MFAIALLGGALVLFNVVYGSSIREEAARLRAEEISSENRKLCDQLGMGSDSARFIACSEALSEARNNEAIRFAREAAGIL